MFNDKVSSYVRDRIDAALARGVIPWRRPWIMTGDHANTPVSCATGHRYHGMNAFMLMAAGFDNRHWGTLDQLTRHGGVRKSNERTSMVVYWKIEEKPVENEKDKTITVQKSFRLLYFNVFNVQQFDWPEGVPEKWAATDPDTVHDPIKALSAADAIVAGYEDKPPINHGYDIAAYIPSMDVVQLPAIQQFSGVPEYYSTLFHELAHSTGHVARLDCLEGAAFGSEGYAREELRAEFTSAMLCALAGISIPTVDNAAAYIAHWRERIKNDPSILMWAATKAERAFQYITKMDPTKIETIENGAQTSAKPQEVVA